MCGINIIVHCDGKPVMQDVLLRMNKAIVHRGPDGSGHFINGNVGLGHTRLSIVDVQHGHQPMESCSGRYVITYNGEIYNFNDLGQNLKRNGVVLKTRCDAEVLLETFATLQNRCLSKLRGMFSFGIYDKSSKTLFAARDRLGIKPFYYYFDGNTFIAASEIKAIFASGLVEPKFNASSIRSHFNYQFAISPFTSFENIFELPPGHSLSLGPDKKLKIEQYWDLEFPEENEYETDDFSYWKSEFENALHSSVSSHMIGDVPIGAYLSGGLDSSTTTLLLKEHYPQSLETFSIHFTNPNSDESYAYRPVAQHLGVSNSELTMEDDREGGYFQLLKNCVYHLEQPQRMAVDIPHFLLSEHVRNKGYKVVYTGDGADEILAGYDCFRQDNIRIWGNEQGSEEAREAFYFAEYGQYFSEEFLNMLVDLHAPDKQKQVTSYFGFYPSWHDFWQIIDSSKKNLFLGNHADEDAEQMHQLVSRIKHKVHNRHPLNQSLYLETKTRLPGWILWKSDRLSMAHGVEARVPFLDHPLVELAARIPPQYKLNGLDEKYILKQIIGARLPVIPGNYKKRGFYTPIKEWLFRDKYSQELSHYFSRQKLEELGLYNPDEVISLLNQLTKTPAPENINDYFKTMKLEWTLMLVITSVMLHELFIAKEAPCFHDI